MITPQYTSLTFSQQYFFMAWFYSEREKEKSYTTLQSWPTCYGFNRAEDAWRRRKSFQSRTLLTYMLYTNYCQPYIFLSRIQFGHALDIQQHTALSCSNEISFDAIEIWIRKSCACLLIGEKFWQSFVEDVGAKFRR